MKNESNIKKNLLWIITFVLVVLVWMGIAPEWYSWYQESWRPENEKDKMWMQSLYELLNGRWLLNIPICVTLGYVTVLWCRRISKDNDIRMYRPMLALMGLVLLYAGSRVDYAKVVCGLDYRVVLTLLLGVMLLIMAIKKWKPNILNESSNRINNWMSNICKKKTTNEIEERKDEVSGFPIDTVDNETIPDNLKQYASIIVNKLLATQINEHSFAIGITGGWGVGKTKFLDLLKGQIKANAEVVEFNPWMCRTPEQVTQDFFSSLRHQLSHKYSTLSKSIREYAKLVGDLPITPHSIFSLDITLPLGKDSLFEKKQNLSMKFSNLPRPVVVFIDDMDRLEREEIFEVLRLIRNTADLINTIYIAAYDREYVTCIIKEKNIKDASSYLEKIFPVEIHLPKVEDKLIWEALKKDFVAQDTKYNGRFARSLFNQFNNDQREEILRVLNNYRHVKRFARLYMLNFSYLNKLFPKEIDLIDLFWLELLQMYDQKAFDKLAYDPYCLLYYDRKRKRYMIRYGILEKSSDTEENTYTGDKFWKVETPRLLELMFGYFVKAKQKSICIPENYDKYFTMSISPFKLSIKEMNDLLCDNANPEEVVNKWLESKKYINSISYQMEQVNVNELQDEQLQTYLHGLLYFGVSVANDTNNIMRFVKTILRERRYAEAKKTKAHDIVSSWIEVKISEGQSLLFLSWFLKRLYLYKEYDENGQEIAINPLIISNEEVKAFLVKVMKEYLDSHLELTAIDIMKEKEELGYLFRNCCVMEEDAMFVKGYCLYSQVSFDAVIDYFSKKDNKPTQKEYSQAYDAMFHQEAPKFDAPWEENDYMDYEIDNYYQNMEAYFGTSYKEKLNEFIAKCFVEVSE